LQSPTKFAPGITWERWSKDYEKFLTLADNWI
jgi:hypothetical protein